MKDLLKRISVAVWGIPLLVYLSYAGGWWFLLFVLIVNGMAQWEFYQIYTNRQLHAQRILGVILSTMFLVAIFFHPEIWQAGALLVVALQLFAHLRQQEGVASINTSLTITGFAYITFFASALLQFRQFVSHWTPELNSVDPHIGGWLIVVFFASIWICDTAAYFGGRMLGKHKLAPNVSPNKTIEGAVMGLLFGVISFWGIGQWLVPDLPVNYALAGGVIVGILGQIGDLVESRFKRDAGVKDTSALLPGHGGFFDRFDSILFVSPFLWMLFKYQLLG